MMKRMIKIAVLAGVTCGLLLAAGPAAAQGPQIPGIAPQAPPPIPAHLRVLRPEQFGSGRIVTLFGKFQDIFGARNRRQLNPPSPHRDILDGFWGTRFHRDPDSIPTTPVPGVGTGGGGSCKDFFSFLCLN